MMMAAAPSPVAATPSTDAVLEAFKPTPPAADVMGEQADNPVLPAVPRPSASRALF